ncbi:MAG: epoxyqueuosine reductase [Clostridia bacterium]|nr:epoxyqueuosine reductase [Clostridia bacterium]
MNGVIESIFKNEKIEYFAVLDYAGLRTYNSELACRAGITPRTAIVFLIPYFVEVPTNLSAYASSLDYHIFVKELTSRLCEKLSTEYPEYKFLGFGDHSPLDERYAALVGGLGIAGDSGMLINEKYGTYTFIADVITDMPPELAGAMQKGEIKECHHCGACKRACPTGILRGCSTDCLSAITQRKGELADFEVEMMRKFNTVWGCDVCQTACPYNKRPAVTPIEFFHNPRISTLTSVYLASLGREELRRHAFGWRGRAVIERNLEKLGY